MKMVKKEMFSNKQFMFPNFQGDVSKILKLLEENDPIYMNALYRSAKNSIELYKSTCDSIVDQINMFFDSKKNAEVASEDNDNAEEVDPEKVLAAIRDEIQESESVYNQSFSSAIELELLNRVNDVQEKIRKRSEPLDELDFRVIVAAVENGFILSNPGVDLTCRDAE